MEPEPAARSLAEALAAMTWTVERGGFVLLGFVESPDPADLGALAPPAQLVREEGETTLLVRVEEADAVLARHPSARVERDLAWIRFDAAMGWEVVGFLAKVTGALAARGVPIGAVCGFSRDHLFVARKHLDATRVVLAELFPQR